MTTIECEGSSEMLKAAEAIINEFPERRIFAFYGELGAGKTTLINRLCTLLGSATRTASPSFSLVNVYDSPLGSLYHFDFYRIKDIREALDIGYEEYFFSGNYCFIEWPEKIESLLPDNTVKITLSTGKDQNTREISF